MKNLITSAVLFTVIIITSCFISSCTKPDTSSSRPKEELIIGNWNINRVQLRLYYGGVFTKDTIVVQKPSPVNFTAFATGNSFRYCFNSTIIDNGGYQFTGTDSLISTTPSNTYRWKMLILTDVLFTAMTTSTNDPAFPGAKVETYYTLVR